MRICFLIPVYNHKEKLASVVEQLEPFGMGCILVDDGSEPECEQEIIRLGQQYDWVTTDRLPQNGGKGAAVYRGLQLAQQQGYSHAFQLDADGQHNLADIPLFLDSAIKTPNAMVLGEAQYDETVPSSRLYARYITHFWVWVETLSLAIRDSMCGFRIYPVDSALKACRNGNIGMRMSFDTEVVVRMHWSGTPAISIPTHVHYPHDGVSHFNLLEDNLEISWAHTKLFFGMLLRLPYLLWNRVG